MNFISRTIFKSQPRAKMKMLEKFQTFYFWIFRTYVSRFWRLYLCVYLYISSIFSPNLNLYIIFNYFDLL